MAPVNWINDFPFRHRDGNGNIIEEQYCGYYPLLTINISGGTIQESIDEYGQREAPAGYHPKSKQEIIASQRKTLPRSRTCEAEENHTIGPTACEQKFD